MRTTLDMDNRLLDRLTVRLLSAGENFWTTYSEISADTPTRADRLFDAHVATILKQNGVRVLYPNDRDCKRCPLLDARAPFAV